MAIRITVGNVFEVKLKNNLKCYFQFIGLDLTQLNSEVIRVFKKRYKNDEIVSVEEVAKDEVEFYAHVEIRYGLQLGLWERIGTVKLENNIVYPSFRGSDDVGDNIARSERWYIWQMNKEFKYIGELEGENQKIDIGSVMIPLSIVYRMETGKYNFVYPGF